MLSEVENLKLHNLKHGIKHSEVGQLKKPAFSKIKLRERRLQKLAEKIHNKVYQRLQHMFNKIKD